MIDTISRVRNRTPNKEKLLKFGFSQKNGCYYISRRIMHDQFTASIFISGASDISVKVFESENGQEYSPAYVMGVCGKFVGAVINECEEQLRIISKSCFDYEAFKSPQAKEIMEYAHIKYNDTPEFLWEKFPTNSILRRKDTQKWYAVFLTIDRIKLNIDGGGIAEIIDLHAPPELVASWIREVGCFPAYHMNKKHWYTICLDNSIPSDEICRRLDISYLLAK